MAQRLLSDSTIEISRGLIEERIEVTIGDRTDETETEYAARIAKLRLLFRAADELDRLLSRKATARQPRPRTKKSAVVPIEAAQ